MDGDSTKTPTRSRRDTSDGSRSKRKKSSSSRKSQQVASDAADSTAEQELRERDLDDSDASDARSAKALGGAGAGAGAGGGAVGKPMGFLSLVAEDAGSSDDAAQALATLQAKPMGFLSLVQQEESKERDKVARKQSLSQLKRMPSIARAPSQTAAVTDGRPAGFLSFLETANDAVVPVVELPAPAPLQPLQQTHVLEGKPAGFLSFLESSLPPEKPLSPVSDLASATAAPMDESDVLPTGKPVGFLSLMSEKEIRTMVTEVSKRPVRQTLRLLLSQTHCRVGDTVRGKVVLTSSVTNASSHLPLAAAATAAMPTKCPCHETATAIVRGSCCFDVSSGQCTPVQLPLYPACLLACLLALSPTLLATVVFTYSIPLTCIFDQQLVRCLLVLAWSSWLLSHRYAALSLSL